MSTEGTESRRILVVDDDEVMRELLFALLMVQGYEVFAAASGLEGSELLRGKNPPKLILTDLQMPGLQGESLTAALREAAPASALLIGMSGSRPSEALLRSLDAFLPKPFDFLKLEAAIQAARETRATRENSAPTPSPVLQTTEPVESEPEPDLDDSIFSALSRTFKPDQLLELYTLTLHDAEERYGRIVEHAAGGDVPSAQREAHAIKGASGMVGARELQRLAGVIEAGEVLNPEAVTAFPEACARLRRLLNAKLQQKW